VSTARVTVVARKETAAPQIHSQIVKLDIYGLSYQLTHFVAYFHTEFSATH